MDKSTHEPPIVLETGSAPAASIIWLHGLGADGHDFEALVPELRLPLRPALRFVFPHAPFRPVTINGGYVMRAWYDIAMTENGIEQNRNHILESEKILQSLIAEQKQGGIPCDQIVLAGFSQGGTVALLTGLHYPEPLAGILSLSAPVPFAKSLMAEIHHANERVPIFMAHGTEDQMIPFSMAESARKIMTAHGLTLTWHEYATGHSVVTDEIRDIANWLKRVFSKDVVK
ncbi:MAG TPA: alpha/beta hydrolase-fold protein [Sulfuricaulis sp.]|jgi:phospholipase/carboxylesterase|nr:alpha/beta hydrolase-fold protein [Sulfuricaulis sp.]